MHLGIGDYSEEPFPRELLHYGFSCFNKSKITFLPFAYYSAAEHRRLKRESERDRVGIVYVHESLSNSWTRLEIFNVSG